MVTLDDPARSPLELGAPDHDAATAGAALHPDIGADSLDGPQAAAAGMYPTHLNDVTFTQVR